MVYILIGFPVEPILKHDIFVKFTIIHRGDKYLWHILSQCLIDNW